MCASKRDSFIWFTRGIVVCNIPLLARALGLNAELGLKAARPIVYKIPYRRARAECVECVARAKVSCIQLDQARATIGYIVYKGNCFS